MQIARTGYLAAYSSMPDATSKAGLDSEISSRRECFQRRGLRRVGLNRERHPRRVRSSIPNGGKMARH